MKRNKPKQQPASSPVARKQFIIPRELGVLPSGWQQDLIPSHENSAAKSAIFRRFADPMLDGTEPLAMLRTKFSVAMMGWNLALIQEGQRMKPLMELLGGFPADLRLSIKETLQFLVERKATQFAEYCWPIHSFHLEPRGEGMMLSVATVDLETTAAMNANPSAE